MAEYFKVVVLFSSAVRERAALSEAVATFLENVNSQERYSNRGS